jgi:hypothetical protein
MGISTRTGITQSDFVPISNGPGNSTYTQTGTIAWTGSSAPSGDLTAQYTWQQVGRDVTLSIMLLYSVAGTAVNTVVMDLPSDAPVPTTISTLGTNANEVAWIGVGSASTSKTTIWTTNGRAAIVRNSADTGWVITIVSSSINAVMAMATINYKTS